MIFKNKLSLKKSIFRDFLKFRCSSKIQHEHHFVDQSWVHFILSSAVRRLIQYQLLFFNRTLHERGSKREIPYFVCVRMLDANFFDLGKMSIFFIFGGLDPEYYNTRIDINIVYVHMLGAKHFLFLKISCFDFFVEKTF